MKKYVVIGGNPIQLFRGGTAFTGLYKVGEANDDTLQELVDEAYEKCGGLLFVLNTETGEQQTDEDMKFSSEPENWDFDMETSN